MDDPADAPAPWWAKFETKRRTFIYKFDDPERDMLSDALAGLQKGSLEPLALFLKEGYDLPLKLRREIVHMITGEENVAFRLQIKKGKRGRGTPASKLETQSRDWEIGFFIAAQLRAHPGEMDAAVKAAEVHYDVKESVAYKAWASFSSGWPNLVPPKPQT
jgi:hypothetical protein